MHLLWKSSYLIRISLKFVQGTIVKKSWLVLMIPCRWIGNKPLFEPMMAYFTDVYGPPGFNELTVRFNYHIQWIQNQHLKAENKINVLAPVQQHYNMNVSTAQCRYNTVNFLQNSHNRNPIARPWGRYKVSVVNLHNLIHFLPLLLQCHM